MESAITFTPEWLITFTGLRRKDDMNKAELVSHVAAETSTTQAAAERMVGAVLSAIADALARE